jgi:NAD(P)-dependent dehydrogenase (short-subunit alcohol dehydrogenase family)
MALTPERALLTDRVAVVTGAAVGIGRAITLAFANFGAHVAMCDRDGENLETVAHEVRALGRRASVGVLDVRRRDAVEEFVGRAVRELDAPLDVLVNNAGGGFRADFVAVNDKGQDALVDENFTSVTNFVRACVPHFPARGASIVNVTSIEAHRAAPGFAVYAAMKAAVWNLTKSLALELGPRLVRVNCIAPDVIPTPGIGDDFGARTPLATRGHVDDCAGAAVFLASDLSRFVTGTTIHVDGGNLAAAGWIRTDDGAYGTGVAASPS